MLAHPMVNLERFTEAQDSRQPGFREALGELRAGRKVSHWIWYVFPQLAGLGSSPMAVRYGVAGAEEAAAYLRDPVLLPRLVSAADAVQAHLAAGPDKAARLDEIMGSDIDAQKLVSSMTLFRHVAAGLLAAQPRPEWAALVRHADTILAAAAVEGYHRCAFTERQLGIGSSSPG
jgi:uncharacterized protein (DUF1810 family)